MQQEWLTHSHRSCLCHLKCYSAMDQLVHFEELLFFFCFPFNFLFSVKLLRFHEAELSQSTTGKLTSWGQASVLMTSSPFICFGLIL